MSKWLDLLEVQQYRFDSSQYNRCITHNEESESSKQQAATLVAEATMASLADELFKDFNNYDDKSQSSDDNDNDQSSYRKVRQSIMLRNDVLVPNVVTFSHNNPIKRNCRRATAMSIILALAVFGFIHVSKIVWGYSQEAVLDIESKNMTSVSSSSTP